MLLQALTWAAVAGVVGRWCLSGQKPGVLLTLLAGLGGCILAFLVGHELLRMHELHLFRPESAIPAVMGAVTILVVTRRASRDSHRGWHFR